MQTLDVARKRIQELEQEKAELAAAIYHYRLTLEHYLTICASVGADPGPAAEALKKLPSVRVGPKLWRVK